MGNLRSVSKAVEYLGAEVEVSNSDEKIAEAEKLIMPGVGSFGDGMKNLAEKDLISALHSAVISEKKPVLGICLGMQLFAEDGEEGGFHKGLGWVPGSVKKMEPGPDLKLPHVGWNDISQKEGNPLFQGLSKNPSFYFVHSYALECADPTFVSATCNYGGEFVAAVQKNNVFGLQFHPEKSQREGLRVLENFINM